MKEKLHPKAKEFLSHLEKEKYAEYRFLTTSLVEISPEVCIQWTLKEVQPQIIRNLSEDFEIASFELINTQIKTPLKENHSKLEKLFWENWNKRSRMNGVDLNLTLAALLAVTSFYTTFKTGYSYKYGALIKIKHTDWILSKIAEECSRALFGVFEDNLEKNLLLIQSFTKQVNETTT